MKKFIGFIVALAVMLPVGMASAVPIDFTLSSYSVSYTSSDPGLVLYVDPILSTPKTWSLDVGQTTSWFNLFRIGTKEVSVNTDDKAQLPISVSFNWSAPPGVVPDNVNGVTYGWSFLWWEGAEVQWSDSPAVFKFGDGEFKIYLSNESFAVPGYADVQAKIQYVKASTVPEPTSLLLLGLGLLGIAGWRRK